VASAAIHSPLLPSACTDQIAGRDDQQRVYVSRKTRTMPKAGEAVLVQESTTAAFCALAARPDGTQPL